MLHRCPIAIVAIGVVRTRYTVPTSVQVAQAEATVQPGSPLGSSTLER